jgi:CRP-like cAMP-binding protein
MEAEIQNPLVTKLSHFAPLSEEDKEILEALCANPERFDADATVVQEDEVPSRGFVLTRGMACRYRNLPDGRRQILTFLLPEISSGARRRLAWLGITRSGCR